MANRTKQNKGKQTPARAPSSGRQRRRDFPFPTALWVLAQRTSCIPNLTAPGQCQCVDHFFLNLFTAFLKCNWNWSGVELECTIRLIFIWNHHHNKINDYNNHTLFPPWTPAPVCLLPIPVQSLSTSCHYWSVCLC